MAITGTATVSPSTGNGVVATTNTANNYALFGQTATAGAIGIYGLGSVAGSYAGLFVGKVTVSGDFNVTGSKSAAVPHPDGTHRLLYCVEAPEAWFEDFGEGRLTGGRAAIALDPDFAAVVATVGNRYGIGLHFP